MRRDLTIRRLSGGLERTKGEAEPEVQAELLRGTGSRLVREPGPVRGDAACIEVFKTAMTHTQLQTPAGE
jgi:hypothetical protein